MMTVDASIADSINVLPFADRECSDTKESSPVPFKAVLLYEDVETAHRATGVSTRLAAGLNPDGPVASSVWRFDLLDDPHCRSLATAEMKGADTIIVSSRLTALPTDIGSWLEACVAASENDCLIVIFLSGTEGSWSITIRHAAHFSTGRSGAKPEIENTFRCGYQAPPMRKSA